MVENLDHVWPRVEKFLSDALQVETPPLPLSTLRKQVENSHSQLWGIAEPDRFLGALITRLVDYEENGKYVEIAYCGGVEIDRWLEKGLWEIESWAQSLGAKYVTLGGRAGWVRKLRPYGYEQSAVHLAKQIKSESEVH